jgi:hypothetical protein
MGSGFLDQISRDAGDGRKRPGKIFLRSAPECAQSFHFDPLGRSDVTRMLENILDCLRLRAVRPDLQAICRFEARLCIGTTKGFLKTGGAPE